MDVPALRREAKRIRDEEKPDLAASRARLDEAEDAEGLALASLVLMRHRAKLREEDWPAVARWAEAATSPEAVDLFAEYVARPLHERAPDARQVARWAKSAEPLMRRLALRVGGIEGAGAALARDESPVVSRALVDALAEEDAKVVEAFLRKHPEMPADVVRAAAALLPPERALKLTLERREGRSRPGRRPPPKRRGG